MSPRLRAYVVATVLAAAGVMAFVRPQDLAHTWGHLMAWAAMCVVSERLSTRTESGATWTAAVEWSGRLCSRLQFLPCGQNSENLCNQC